MSLNADLETNLDHPAVGIGEVFIAVGALNELRGALKTLPTHAMITVLTDESVILTARGTDLKSSVLERLDGLGQVMVVVLKGDVHADEETVRTATEGCSTADVVVTVGSGTLCDIGKVAAVGRPHVVVQSAASVNGFADDQSVLLISGVKRTTHSSWPHTLVIDTDVLTGAPVALNRSGLGDMISMFTAPADWYLASLVGMDHGWSLDSATMTRRYGDELRSIARGVGEADPVALETLARFVTLSGLSMGVAGQTSPSSGMEHTVSHLLDMAHSSRGTDTALHGAQVGVATVVVAILWRRMVERIANGTIGALVLPEPVDAEHAVRAAFDWMDETGATSDECWTDYSKKLAHLRSIDATALMRSIVNTWARNHNPTVSSLLEAPGRIVRALAEAGAPTRFSELNSSGESDDVLWAIRNCHLMRNRFTIADLAFLTGSWTEEEIRSVLDEARGLGAGL